MTRSLGFPVAALLSLALLASGCGSGGGKSSGGGTGDLRAEDVRYASTLRESTWVDSYEWRNARDQAWVSLDAPSLDGALRVEVYDGGGAAVFDRTFDGGSPARLEATSRGQPGRWRVIVTTLRASGSVSLRVY